TGTHHSQLHEDERLRGRRSVRLHRMHPDDLPGQGSGNPGFAGRCHRISRTGYVRPPVGADVGGVSRAAHGAPARGGHLQFRARGEAVNIEGKRSAPSRPMRAMLLAAAMLAGPALAHHSFAPYDMQKTIVFTGVVTRVNPDANHLQIFFAPMNDERKNVVRNEKGEPVVCAVEMAGSAQSARQGISVSTFPRGTIFSVAMHPLRSGEPAGSREGPMFKCP